LDDVQFCLDVINGVLRKRNLSEISYDYYHQIFDFPVRKYYNKLGFDFEKEPFEVVAKEFILGYNRGSRSCELHENAYEVLSKIRKEGISQSVLSAMNQVDLMRLIKHFGLDQFFVEVVGLSDHYARSKIENGKMLIKNLNFSSDEIIMIGDTVHDYDVAREMGVHSILIASGHHPKEKLEKCGVTVLDTLEEVLGSINTTLSF
jgi:phosphoglycolate phosphatase